jgi:hypothetical protein
MRRIGGWYFSCGVVNVLAGCAVVNSQNLVQFVGCEVEFCEASKLSGCGERHGWSGFARDGASVAENYGEITRVFFG